VKDLIAAGADVNAKDKSGRTALSCAEDAWTAYRAMHTQDTDAALSSCTDSAYIVAALKAAGETK
jgi:hypothetical protein